MWRGGRELRRNAGVKRSEIRRDRLGRGGLALALPGPERVTAFLSDRAWGCGGVASSPTRAVGGPCRVLRHGPSPDPGAAGPIRPGPAAPASYPPTREGPQP